MSHGGDGGGRPFALAARVAQVVIVSITGYGAVVGSFGIVVNGVLSLAVTFVPDLLERRYDHEVDPRLALWIAAAAAIHVAGFLGPYEAETGLLTWYDQVAHVVSGALVGGVGYALVEAYDRGSDRVNFPGEFRFVFTLAFIVAFAVLWEIGEFAGGALGTALAGTEVLVQYGISDVVSDLVFSTLAAVVVALWGTGYFEDVAAIFTGRLPGSESR